MKSVLQQLSYLGKREESEDGKQQQLQYFQLPSSLLYDFSSKVQDMSTPGQLR